MKKYLVAMAMLLLLAMPAQAAKINFTSVTGAGVYYQNGVAGQLSYLTDNYIPPEWGFWQTNTTYFYRNTSYEYFFLDMGRLYTLQDMLLSLDNNDTYHVDYSTTGSSWSRLLTVYTNYGNVMGGMDTFSTLSSAGSALYDSRIDFAPTSTRYLRVWADQSQGDGAYSIGEIQAFGEVVGIQGGSSVPEPATVVLLAIGLTGLLFIRQRKML